MLAAAPAFSTRSPMRTNSPVIVAAGLKAGAVLRCVDGACAENLSLNGVPPI